MLSTSVAAAEVRVNSTYVLCPVPESDEFLRLKRKPSRTEYAYGDVEVTIGYVDAKESP